MQTRISHFVIGWNNSQQLVPIPVMARISTSEGIDIVNVEDPYEAAEARKSTLYLISEKDFIGDDRFQTFKVNDEGKGWPSMTSGCWILDHLIISESLSAIQKMVFYLKTKALFGN